MKKRYKNTGELMQGFNGRDSHAITEVYERVHKQLCSYCYSIVDDTTEAEDIVTEVFIKLLEDAGTHFNSFQDMRYHLYTAVRWASLNSLKKQRRQKDEAAAIDILTDAYDEPIQTIMLKADIVNEVYNEIYKFRDIDQQLIELSFVHGYTAKQIGEILGMAEQSVHNRKSELIKSLRIAMIRKTMIMLLLIDFYPN
jgi:RNA polymerase sigma-70 factor, ECF subfamily